MPHLAVQPPDGRPLTDHPQALGVTAVARHGQTPVC